MCTSNKLSTLSKLQQRLSQRKQQLHKRSDSSKHSYVCQLYEGGIDKIGKKVTEEAGEVLMAAKDYHYQANTHNKQHLINEATDLLFHLMVLLTQMDCSIEEVLQESEKRLDISGLVEKKQRKVTSKESLIKSGKHISNNRSVSPT